MSLLNTIAPSPALAPWTRQPRPLMSVGAAAFILSWRQARVEYAVERGTLPTVDVRSAASQRTALRVFSPAVNALKADGAAPRFTTAQMVEAILPAEQTLFTQAEVAYRFHVCVDHIVRLCDAGVLREGGIRLPRGGRQIARASLLHFITERRAS